MNINKYKYRYINFKNKYIKNKSQIGKGNNNNLNNDENELDATQNPDKGFEIIEGFTNKYLFHDNIYNLKLLSILKNGTIPITQFPQRMIFCEDAIHDIGAMGSVLLQNLSTIINNNLIEKRNLPGLDAIIKKGDPSSLDAIIKIENENYNSQYYDADFETIQKLNYISDHDGIVLKLNEIKNTSSIKSEYINIISFNLEGLCRQTLQKNDKIYIEHIFAQRLELLDIHLRKYIDRNQSFILICQEIVLQKKVSNNEHSKFLENSCFEILKKLKEIRGSNDITVINDGYTSGIFYSLDNKINNIIEIERFEKKKSEEVFISNEVLGNESNEITLEVLKDNVSSNSNNTVLKKKSNAYLINSDFWIVNIHLKASASLEQHVDELRNIINMLFTNNNYNNQNVYLIGDFNHANTDDNPTLDLVNLAITNKSVLVPEQVNQNSY